MPAPVAHRQMAKAFRHDDGQLTRIIIVGESPALIALVAELYLFRPNLHIILVLPNRLDNDEAMAHLAALDLNWQACQGQTQNGGLKIPRHGGQGSLTVYSTSNQALPAMATQLAEEIDELQAAIFLSAEEGLDPDASTSLRVMRFVEAMDKRPWSQTHHLNLLAELHAESRGALLQKDLRKITSNHHGMRLTPVSADRIKHYFMVHSAFVPGVGQIYDELLGEYGQDLMRLDPMDITGVVTYHELREILAPRRMIPIAIELESSTMRLHPQWDEKIDLSQLKALIVLGDTRRDLAHLKAL